MPKSSITIQVDDSLKEKFTAFCDEIGFSNTLAITLFMKAVVRDRRIPFLIKGDTEAAPQAAVATTSDGFVPQTCTPVTMTVNADSDGFVPQTCPAETMTVNSVTRPTNTTERPGANGSSTSSVERPGGRELPHGDRGEEEEYVPNRSGNSGRSHTR